MALSRSLAIDKEAITGLSQSVILLSAAVLAPFLHNQIITGSIVNATLFIAACLLGPKRAVLIGLLPSLFALAVGTLPIVMAPLVPFIVLSNILLISAFTALRKTGYLLAASGAAVIKFLFLASASYWAVSLLPGAVLAKQASAMLSWPQLATALIGGALAYAVIKGGRLYDMKL